MHFILSWLSLLLVVFCAIIYPLRKIIIKFKLPREHIVCKANRGLRKIHKPMSIIAILVVYLHCRVAFTLTGIRSGLGVFLLVAMLLLGISYMLRKVLKKHWMTVHRILVFVLILGTAYHAIFEFL